MLYMTRQNIVIPLLYNVEFKHNIYRPPATKSYFAILNLPSIASVQIGLIKIAISL
jgi:hypothetical protein